MAPSSPENKPISKHRLSLTQQIRLSGIIAILLFIGIMILSISFAHQIQEQNQNFKVGTIFSDRSASQLQRELLRLRAILSNPDLADEKAFLLQISLLQSRFNILDDSMAKIQPTENILAQHDDLKSHWELLLPDLANWGAIKSDPILQEALLGQVDAMELKANNMVRQYEVLRLARGQSATDASERLMIILGIGVVLFLLFVLTIIYNTYRFIQERAQTEEQLAIYATELERSNDELQQFAYVASHDLQEPLRKIRTFGERLQMRNQDKLDGRSLDYIARMNNAAERMHMFIEDLLAFSRVTTQTEPFEETDLNAILQTVILDLETQIEQVNGEVVAQPLPTVEADPLQMRQLLQNLVSNGLKFHRQDVAPVVTIKGESFTKNGRKQVHILVQDNGIGIDEKYADRIFEMFQRLHGRSDYEGTGIGLTICRRIAERHGGTITVHSQPNEGTTFIVTLPAKQN